MLLFKGHNINLLKHYFCINFETLSCLKLRTNFSCVLDTFCPFLSYILVQSFHILIPSHAKSNWWKSGSRNLLEAGIPSTSPLKLKYASKNPQMEDYVQKKGLVYGFNWIFCHKFCLDETSIKWAYLFFYGNCPNYLLLWLYGISFLHF